METGRGQTSKRAWVRKRFRYSLYGLIIFVVLAVLAPLSPRTSSVYLDIVNGQRKSVERLFGMVQSEKVSKTEFSELVAKHKLHGEPEWVRISYVGSDLSGGFEFCVSPYHAHLWSAYRDFATRYFPDSGMDDPTTAIIEIRRLAKIGHGHEVEVFLLQYMEDIAATHQNGL